MASLHGLQSVMDLTDEDLDVLHLHCHRRRTRGEKPPHGTQWADVYQESVLNALKDKRFDPTRGTRGGRLWLHHWRAYADLYRRAKLRERVERQALEAPMERRVPCDPEADRVEISEFLSTLTEDELTILLNPQRRMTAKARDVLRSIESRFEDYLRPRCDGPDESGNPDR